MSYTKGSMPIGTIVSSFLNSDQFKRAVRVTGDWDDQSEWNPCDGRLAGNSEYKKLSDRVNVPDLRGVFLRCVNTIDPSNQTHIPDGQKNDEEPAFGVLQKDAFQIHAHAYTGRHLEADGGGGFNGSGFDSNSNHNGAWEGGYTSSNSGQSKFETRPKNLSVFYYIKIN
ncbi:MAG: hypothetical protein JWO03_3454 [Bacteroidetes bacterium]|nr:hypothetical protein [Bacteroidota bacterium]